MGSSEMHTSFEEDNSPLRLNDTLPSHRSNERVNIQIKDNSQKEKTGTKPKRGVSRKLARLLKPDNEVLGGKPIQATIFTKNGFAKRRFEKDDLDEQER